MTVGGAMTPPVRVGAAVAIGAYVLGLAPSSALLLAAVAAAGAVLVRIHGGTVEIPPRPDGRRRHGTRRELERLARSQRSRSSAVDHAAVQRLALIARGRLADLDLEPDGPAAVRMLGPLAYGVLFERPAGRPVTQRSYARCLDAVERLDLRRQEREFGKPTRGSR